MGSILIHLDLGALWLLFASQWSRAPRDIDGATARGLRAGQAEAGWLMLLMAINQQLESITAIN